MPIDPKRYKDREQTYVKHLFLDLYLERLAWNILANRTTLVYVDAFSGPWRNDDDAFADTSFSIALRVLKKVCAHQMKSRGLKRSFRGIFVEKNLASFRELKEHVNSHTEAEVLLLNDQFENVVKQVVDFVGWDFSFTFIDPTGWTGFSMAKIVPVLKLEGEILLNFMFNDINRFAQTRDAKIIPSLDKLFGDSDWLGEFEILVDSEGVPREEALLEVYKGRLQRFGDFKHVTSTRVLFPGKNRTYFHLIYGTRHSKGIWEFRAVERKSAKVQEQIHTRINIARSLERTGMSDLFSGQRELPESTDFHRARNDAIRRAEDLFHLIVQEHTEIEALDLAAEMMQIPLFWENDFKALITSEMKKGSVRIKDKRPRQRVPKRSDILLLSQ